MDFALLPPEINSGRMYAGPGSGPMLAAAETWEGLAAQLHSVAASYESVVSGLAVQWRGVSAAMMVAAAGRYITWLITTAAQAEDTAMRARAVAAAFETAFVSTVPPPAVVANRVSLMALIVTNFLGQNTAAIMATEAQYAEMWAQDAAAMYGYARSAATAAQMTPFSTPPQTTNQQPIAAQATAVTQAAATIMGTPAQTEPQPMMSVLPQALHNLAMPVSAATATDPPGVLSTLDSFFTGPLSPLSLFTLVGLPAMLGPQNYLLPQAAANLASAADRVAQLPAAAGGELVEGGLAEGMRSMGSTSVDGVSVGTGHAGQVGGLSVPHGWASAAPEIKAAAAVVPESGSPTAQAAFGAEGEASLLNDVALSSLAGRTMIGTGGTTVRSEGVGRVAAGAGQVANTAYIFVIPEADE